MPGTAPLTRAEKIGSRYCKNDKVRSQAGFQFHHLNGSYLNTAAVSYDKRKINVY